MKVCICVFGTHLVMQGGMSSVEWRSNEESCSPWSGCSHVIRRCQKMSRSTIVTFLFTALVCSQFFGLVEINTGISV